MFSCAIYYFNILLIYIFMFNWVIYHYLFWTGSHFLPAFKSDFFPDCLTIPVLDIFQKTNEHVFHHRAVLPTSYKGISYWPFNVNFWTFNTQREQSENQTKVKTSRPSLSGNQSKTRYVIPTHLFVFRCSRLSSRQIIQILGILLWYLIASFFKSMKLCIYVLFWHIFGSKWPHYAISCLLTIV